MYIIVKQLSNANPKKNRQSENVQNPVQKAVKTPKINPIMLQPTSAGILP